jgi:hypothetical protein
LRTTRPHPLAANTETDQYGCRFKKMRRPSSPLNTPAVAYRHAADGTLATLRHTGATVECVQAIL